MRKAWDRISSRLDEGDIAGANRLFELVVTEARAGRLARRTPVLWAIGFATLPCCLLAVILLVI